MKETLIMTQEGQKKVKIMEMLMMKQIKQEEAAKMLSLSVRQIKRILKKYKIEGDEALNHGLIGKPSNHRTKEDVKNNIMRIVRDEYDGFKPTFIAEKLYEDHHIQIDPSTLRLWMIDEGLWKKVRKTAIHRSRRPRKEHFGEMIQMDGSIHDWLVTGEKVCLMNMVDDATGISYGLFDEGETTQIALRSLFDWITKYGIPNSIYSDYKSLFYTKRETTIEEQLAGKNALTKFGMVCNKLGIEMIYANSPQAKGRVERWNGIHQDRLISELKLKKINNIDSANKFLKEYYWEKNNNKFGKKPLSDSDFHIPLIPDQDLRNFVCYMDNCKIYKDFTLKLNNRIYQLRKEQKISIKPGDSVKVNTWLDGSVHIFINEVTLNFFEIDNYGYKISA